MTDKEEIKFAIRYLKKGLKSKRTPPLYEELMKELGFVKNVKSESCCQRCALPNDLVGSAWCTQHCQHDNRFKRNKEFAELNKEIAELKDKLNNLASVAKVRLANWQKYSKELKEAKELIRQLCSMVRELNKPNVQLTNVDYSLAEAEQFISEVKK